MSALFDAPPFSARDDEQLLREMHEVTERHRAGCPEFARIWPPRTAPTLAGLPYLHVGLFKRLALRTQAPGLAHQRTLLSSGTSSATASKITLDDQSSVLQARSSQLIFEALLGTAQVPLVVLDSVATLRSRDGVAARIMAALALRPLSSDLHFVLDGAGDDMRLSEDKLVAALAGQTHVRVYGFTWRLWRAWRALSPRAVEALRGVRVDLVHSGGWKKLAAEAVTPALFEATLLATAAPGSRVLDFYGLVEQVGVVFPLCSAGVRHVPRWAAVIVRDPLTSEPLAPGVSGVLQLMNPLALGAPYHSVLTEDTGHLVPSESPCACGQGGQRFVLEGRIARAEVRGCANV